VAWVTVFPCSRLPLPVVCCEFNQVQSKWNTWMNMRTRELGKDLIPQVWDHLQYNLLPILLATAHMDSTHCDAQHLSPIGNFLKNSCYSSLKGHFKHFFFQPSLDIDIDQPQVRMQFLLRIYRSLYNERLLVGHLW